VHLMMYKSCRKCSVFQSSEFWIIEVYILAFSTVNLMISKKLTLQPRSENSDENELKCTFFVMRLNYSGCHKGFWKMFDEKLFACCFFWFSWHWINSYLSC